MVTQSQKEFLVRTGAISPNHDLQTRLRCARMPPSVLEVAEQELRMLDNMRAHHTGYAHSLAYLEFLADLPWKVSCDDQNISLRAAKAQLDSRHFGLSKVKRRILEYIAVRKMRASAGGGPVLCFVGPPGVGKTSIACAIAEALRRPFVRISLAGVKDEAVIRGHRKSYASSTPGRIVEGVKRTGVNNPVMLLDEIDKIGNGSGHALLEVLDPEQNHKFVDHYLNVPFDLSDVMFIATANTLETVPPPLLDRLEVIKLPGYTLEEKLEIAMHHVLPKVLHQHGLTSLHLQIPKPVMKTLIQQYTSEAGIRNLEHQLAALARAVALDVADQDDSWDMDTLARALGSMDGHKPEELSADCEPSGVIQGAIVNEEMLGEVLGPPNQTLDIQRVAMIQDSLTLGVAIGLVFTKAGGALQFIEATMVPGKGDLHLTGQPGDVMKQSARTALTWVRSKAANLKLGHTLEHTCCDIHIHFPEASLPKDGPSMGVALAAALVSLMGKRHIRKDTAMTGEITLNGIVLPVGGIKDKVLAAHRCGIRRVILPESNMKDVQQVPIHVLDNMQILAVRNLEELLREALCPIQIQAKL